ncbi:MAG: DUF6428 family protein [Luteibaculum sp.]
MKLNEIKQHLSALSELQFVLPNGDSIPAHFHITEVGKNTKYFVDCGGKMRLDEKISIQLWHADDLEHRLSPQKLLSIFEKASDMLQLANAEITVEYQQDTVALYNLQFEKGYFKLTPTHTDCLAKEQCGLPAEKPRVKLSALGQNACDPNSNCC